MNYYVQVFGAIFIEGPKWSGKTWTAHMHVKSPFLVSDPAGNFQNRQLAQLDPLIVLDGHCPRLIDEWQEVPSLWDAVRFIVDEKAIIRTMYSYWLFNTDSSGAISLKDICNGICETKVTGEVKQRTLASLLLRGGWPGNIGLSTQAAVLLPTMYLKNVVDEDVDRIDHRKRDKGKLRLLLRSLARNESTTATKKKLKDDMMGAEKATIDEDTITDYLDVFTSLFILENQKPFGVSLRSSLSVRQAEKRHFTDPSFACSLLGITQEEKLIGDLQTFGFMFEALCERDLRIYAQSFGGELYHYQDYENDEIDAVIAMPDGSWSAFEIKLGANQIDAAADSLKKIQAKFVKPASSLCVVCGLSNAAYKRSDGVFVVPLTALRP